MSIKENHVTRLNGAAEGIVAALGSDWTVSRPASHDLPSGLFISDGTRELHFYLPSNSDKVELTGVYPDKVSTPLYDHGVRISRPRIRFSVERPAPQIARDIERRFLPDYDGVRALAVKRVEADEAASARLDAALATVATALSVKRRKESTELRAPMSDSAGYGDFRPNSDGSSWEITLRSVPEDVARQIAEVLAVARKGG